MPWQESAHDLLRTVGRNAESPEPARKRMAENVLRLRDYEGSTPPGPSSFYARSRISAAAEQVAVGRQECRSVAAWTSLRSLQGGGEVVIVAVESPTMDGRGIGSLSRQYPDGSNPLDMTIRATVYALAPDSEIRLTIGALKPPLCIDGKWKPNLWGADVIPAAAG